MFLKCCYLLVCVIVVFFLKFVRKWLLFEYVYVGDVGLWFIGYKIMLF